MSRDLLKYNINKYRIIGLRIDSAESFICVFIVKPYFNLAENATESFVRACADCRNLAKKDFVRAENFVCVSQENCLDQWECRILMFTRQLSKQQNKMFAENFWRQTFSGDCRTKFSFAFCVCVLAFWAKKIGLNTKIFLIIILNIY